MNLAPLMMVTIRRSRAVPSWASLRTQTALMQAFLFATSDIYFHGRYMHKTLPQFLNGGGARYGISNEMPKLYIYPARMKVTGTTFCDCCHFRDTCLAHAHPCPLFVYWSQDNTIHYVFDENEDPTDGIVGGLVIQSCDAFPTPRTSSVRQGMNCYGNFVCIDLRCMYASYPN